MCGHITLLCTLVLVPALLFWQENPALKSRPGDKLAPITRPSKDQAPRYKPIRYLRVKKPDPAALANELARVYGHDVSEEEILEFQLTYPDRKDDTQESPQDATYRKVWSASSFEARKKHPNFLPLAAQARQNTSPFLRAKGVLVVAQHMVTHGEKPADLLDEALATADLQPNQQLDVINHARHILEKAGDQQALFDFDLKYPTTDPYMIASRRIDMESRTKSLADLPEVMQVVSQEVAKLEPNMARSFYSFFAQRRASMGDFAGAELLLTNYEPTDDDQYTAPMIRKKISRFRALAETDGTLGQIYPPNSKRDPHWREKALRYADDGADHPVYETYEQFELLRGKESNESRSERAYRGTDITVAKRDPIAKQFAEALMNDEYLPDERMEAFRFLFDDPIQDQWLMGWAGQAVQVVKVNGTSSYLVRISFHPRFKWEDGGSMSTGTAHRETWKFTPKTNELEYLGGQKVGTEMVISN